MLALLGIIVVLAIVAFALFLGGRKAMPNAATVGAATPSTVMVNVVAAENFYGDIAAQLGGSHVNVTSILSDPNADPHEYESSVPDGIAISNANIIIENGADYDTWMDKLLSASPNSSRDVITAATIAPHMLPDNPHVWYGVENIPAIAQAITTALEKADPADSATFDANLATFDNSLAPLTQKMAEIKTAYNGTPVGLTETIYLYQTDAMGLNVLTPWEFQHANAEGNDPSAADVKTTNEQISGKQVKILIYNNQTITPVTTDLQTMAQQLHIPVVPVSETMPPNQTYQTWMLSQMNALEQALAQATGK